MSILENCNDYILRIYLYLFIYLPFYENHPVTKIKSEEVHQNRLVHSARAACLSLRCWLSAYQQVSGYKKQRSTSSAKMLMFDFRAYFSRKHFLKFVSRATLGCLRQKISNDIIQIHKKLIQIQKWELVDF